MGSIYDTRHHLAMRLEAAGIRTLSLYKGMICCLNIDRSRSPLKTRRAGSPVTPGSRGHSRASLTTCVRGKLKQGNFIGFKAVRPSVLYRFRTCKDSGNPAISAFHIATAPAKTSTGIVDPSLEANWPLLECDRRFFRGFSLVQAVMKRAAAMPKPWVPYFSTSSIWCQ